MYLSTRAIVLHISRYTDRYSIAHVYSEQMGRISVMLPVGGKRSGSLRALFIPLSEVDLELKSTRGIGEIYRINEARAYRCHWGIQRQEIKCSQALFLSELLYRTLLHTEGEASLYTFVAESLATFDALERGVANFYLYFSLSLLQHLAIGPSLCLPRGYDASLYWFDLVEACYTLVPSNTALAIPPSEASYCASLGRMQPSNLHLYRLNRHQRGRIIDWIMIYYRLHFPNFCPLKSLNILRGLPA